MQTFLALNEVWTEMYAAAGGERVEGHVQLQEGEMELLYRYRYDFHCIRGFDPESRVAVPLPV